MLTNYFKVNVGNVDEYLSHYSVSVSYEDDRPVNGKDVGRKVIDRVHETYRSDLDGKDFKYDGEKSLFIIGSLPRNKLEFIVIFEDVTSNRNNENASLNGHDIPNAHDKKRLRLVISIKNI